MRAATGDYLALFDADDICAPERIAVQVAAMRACPSLALCATEFSAFDEHGFSSPAFSKTYYSALDDIPGGIAGILKQELRIENIGGSCSLLAGSAFPQVLFGNFLHPPTLLFPRKTWTAAGDFDETIRVQADWHWIARATRTGLAGFITMPLLDYRLSPMQLSGSARRAERAQDGIEAARKIWQLDPVAAGRLDRERRAFMAAVLRDAADALSDRDKRLAGRYLFDSLREQPAFNWEMAKIAAKIATPVAAIHLFRRIRGRAPDGAPSSAA